jgi:methionine-rich copper-binding protein CopC
MNPTASSYVFWMFVVALVIYGLAVIWHVGLRRVIVVTQELPGQSAPAPYLSFAAFLVGLSVLVVIMEPVHIAFTGYDGVVAAWRAGLPLIVGFSATSGFLFGLTGTAGIIRAALAVSLPSAAYAALAWAAYFLLTSLVPTDDLALREELARFAVPIMSLVTAFPMIAFAASVAASHPARLILKHAPVRSAGSSQGFSFRVGGVSGTVRVSRVRETTEAVQHGDPLEEISSMRRSELEVDDRTVPEQRLSDSYRISYRAPVRRESPARSRHAPRRLQFATRLRSLGLARILLLALGLWLLLSASTEFLVPRARFVDSIPVPGLTVAVPPSSVRITFDRELHPSSGVLVWKSDRRNVARVDRGLALEPHDAGRQTLVASLEPDVPEGLYRVEWRARTAALYFTPWGTQGTFYFGVRVPVPTHLTAREWDEGSLEPATGGDARLYELFAGAICLLVGLVWPWIRRLSTL